METTRRTRVYVAGPITRGDYPTNVRAALMAANALIDCGYAPYIPHLDFMLSLTKLRPYDEWLSLDFEWIPVCDALLRLPGESPGADKEVAYAQDFGLSVYTTMQDLLNNEPPRRVR